MKKKLTKASLFIASLLLLASCDAAPVSEKISYALPNLWVTLAQLAAFGVTVFVFFKFAYQPIKKKLKERNDAIETNIKESKQAKEEARKSQEIADCNIKDSRVQANQIIEDAQSAADKEAQRIIEEANAQANAIRAQSEIDAQERKKAVEREVHNEIVTTALAASKEILGRELTQEDNEKVVDDFIEKMNQEEADK